LAVVVTIAKGYGRGYIWKSHGVKPAQYPRLLRPQARRQQQDREAVQRIRVTVRALLGGRAQ
jgi:hypothetical protein